jgi:ATP-binding cassette, subfamily B (MDR/TAP), member 1
MTVKLTYQDIANAFAAAKRIRSMRPESKSEEELLPFQFGDGENDEKGVRGMKIELKNVWFKYPTRDVMVLKGLDMTVSIKRCFRVQS